MCLGLRVDLSPTPRPVRLLSAPNMRTAWECDVVRMAPGGIVFSRLALGGRVGAGSRGPIFSSRSSRVSSVCALTSRLYRMRSFQAALVCLNQPWGEHNRAAWKGRMRYSHSPALSLRLTMLLL